MVGKTISIRLNVEEIKKIEEIGKKEGLKRSAIIKKAVNQFTQSYEGGSTSTDNVKRVNELEKRFSALLTRVNILTTQTDNILKRLSKPEQNK